MSYAEAYDYDLTQKGAINVCGACASKLLRFAKITAYQSKLLEASALNDIFVDKELAKVITQDMDFGDKIRAINEYNKLRGRHTKNLNLNVKGRLQVAPENEIVFPQMLGFVKFSSPKISTFLNRLNIRFLPFSSGDIRII